MMSRLIDLDDVTQDYLDDTYTWKRLVQKRSDGKTITLKATGHELIQGMEDYKELFEDFDHERQQAFFDEVGFPYDVIMEDMDHDQIASAAAYDNINKGLAFYKND
tara:strand:+ start:298 stop:615 length:318 start_codon:yes stop_codon:yes gene_type:complete